MDDGYAPCICHKGITWDVAELDDRGYCPKISRADRMEDMISRGYEGPDNDHDA